MLENKARERSKRLEDAVQLWQKKYGRQPSQDTEQKIHSLGWQEKGGWLRQLHVKDFHPFKRDYREADKAICLHFGSGQAAEESQCWR